MSTRVLLVDDEALMRAGLRLILDADSDIEVVGEADGGHAALALAEELRPDVILMDIRMPDLDGIEATRRIAATLPSTRIVILTTYDLDEHLYEALVAGAAGFLLKSAPAPKLVETVKAAAAGDTVLAPAITQRLLADYVRTRRSSPASDARLRELTEREREVLGQMATGRSNAEIARVLYVSEATVKTHVNTIFRKLAVRDRVQAVIIAYESGLAGT